MSKERKPSKEIKELDKTQEQLENLKLQLARALADYDNLKRRVERDVEEFEPRIKSRIFSRIAPTLDMFYDVQKNLQDGGLAMAIGELENNLKQENIIKIEVSEGDEFNEELHEAIEAVPTSPDGSDGASEPGTIKELVQNGWMFADGPVIRHAKVVVFK